MTHERFFNTAGPVDCKRHYCLPPLNRFNLPEILDLIRQEKYFVLHAPRQTGKTSCLLALMEHLNQAGTYTCLYINIENAQAARENVKAGIRSILAELADKAENYLHDEFIGKHWKEILENDGEFNAFQKTLSEWAKASPKPLVLLIDEVDALIGDTLISLLRQLRSGYAGRPALFPQSVILCGVRDVRDYRIHSTQEKTIITGGSAFNIKAESLRLGDFSRDEIALLYQCHTDATGQPFMPEAVDLAGELTEGQPWIVNALGYEVCWKIPEGRDRANPITAEMIQAAKERIIARRETHIDQLADKLQEERVRRVIEPILSGVDTPEDYPPDDLSYVRDLGLIKTEGQVRIANRLYQEVIPRELTYVTQLTISEQPQWYIRPDDGQLDMPKLMAAFQEFFRKHSESWGERFRYKEAGPQLLMQAFLSRIINGGGRIEREYGLGMKRTDLLAIWPHRNGVQHVVIELKIRYGDLDETIRGGVEQTWEYMDRCGATEGHLVMFDRRKQVSWAEKIFCRQEQYRGTTITVWGM
ncbi:hypothetical protein U14_03886 [Candidatus Moduliflexus flocculans]|uniref:AAA+ ATPase domain-containing protein n=1 Tax=Candidatus Moduliflexus flocculans TaxID=1499966 RepID=A0A081BQG8_9BACT|nr:hypothetical protein U14_03886 [Candidatus Moduliflexus flocculans]